MLFLWVMGGCIICYLLRAIVTVLLTHLAVPPLGIYAIVQVSSKSGFLATEVSNRQQNFNIPLQLQPQIFGLEALFCWAQTLIYAQ